ncbi:hypothetical protein EV643_110266 [Kribbella sp. VKM Ac-2527]|uniref:Uncharacterized protein n=1 Tax=Kribbella caucasensis TaxID=2512215 RepID=A0A4R6KC87_9ACTN|nr:hypothetical protein [Kribbella sp. VKM Ac-2527]TDO46883.1 hypothetical protein EV643_110266 [Kribbella sp. VKM Ac-2527]
MEFLGSDLDDGLQQAQLQGGRHPTDMGATLAGVAQFGDRR